jgi:hypothetical protein
MRCMGGIVFFVYICISIVFTNFLLCLNITFSFIFWNLFFFHIIVNSDFNICLNLPIGWFLEERLKNE